MMKMNSNGNFPGGNNKRRALSRIDDNIIRAHPYHCAVKRKYPREDAPCNNNTSSIQEPIRSNQSGNCITLDADANTQMFLHHAEAMLEEINHTEAAEIEMEDIFVEEEEEDIIIDIDECDRSNPLAVADYIDDLYVFYKKTECLSCVPPNYMAQQPDINERMRAILIDWLTEVHYKFELVEETLYLTVNIIDRFLAIRLVVRKDLQLVGVTALLLACKYEEVSVPLVDDLIIITNKAYSRKQVLDMEKLMVNTLQFNLSVPTPYVFMRRFLKAAAQSDKRMEMLSFYIMELCLVEYEMVGFPPSLLAAGAVYTAQCTVMGGREWSKTSEKHSGYNQEKLLECGRMMVRYHEKASSGKLRGVYNKYTTSKYGHAAYVHPAEFLIH